MERLEKTPTERIRLVYLAGPIDQVKEEDPCKYGWREDMSQKFLDIGVCSYSPCHGLKWDKSMVGAEKVMVINWAALDQCDLLLAWLPDTPISVGTIREIQRAKDRDMKVLVITDIKGSVYLTDCVVVNRFDQAVAVVAEFNKALRKLKQQD